MPLILAIEPDPAQAEAVRVTVGSLAGVELVLVDSATSAIAALERAVPDPAQSRARTLEALRRRYAV